MAPENEKEQNTPIIDIEKIVNEKVDSVVKAKDEEISKLSEKLSDFAKEIEFIKSFNIQSKQEPVIPKVETTQVADDNITDINPLGDLLKMREQEKERIEQQKAVLENHKMKEENEILKLKFAVLEELKTKPYLEEVINEAIKEGRVKNTNDLKILVSPTMEQKLKVAFELEQQMKKAGIDPLSTYSNDTIVTNVADIAKQKEYDAMKDAWAKKLNKR